jgi:hypothetical protein
MTSPEKRALSWQQIAEDQDGVLGRMQALSSGLTGAGWDWRVGRDWTAIGDGVAVLNTGTPTASQLRWAAVVHAGPGAALTGDAALVAWGAKRLAVAVHDVAVPERRHVRWVRDPSLTMRPRRVRGLAELVSPRPGVPLVHVHVAALHAAERAPSDREAEHRIAMVVQQRLTTAARIRAALELMPRLRRRGLLRVVLDDVELGAHAGSELDYLRFCRRNGLPEPDDLQVRVRANGVKYLDARYRKQRVSIELDGAHHLWVEQWDADALRSLELAAATSGSGEQLHRLTQGMLRHSEAAVAQALRVILG